jgi:hypothetical protein
MKSKDVVYGIFSFILLYVFFYQLVYSFFKATNTGWSALFLTLMLNLSLLMNPLIYNSAAFKAVFSKK